MNLEKEFEIAKENIKLNNYIKIIDKLKKFYIDLELGRTGILIKQEEALEMAHNAYCCVKNAGVLDELNILVKGAQ